MKSRRMSACLIGGILLTGLAAGCASAGAQAPASGHLSGRLVMEGGPLGPGGKQPGERPMSGTVTFTAAGHQPITVKVGSSGTFSVPLPAGRYQVSGRSRQRLDAARAELAQTQLAQTQLAQTELARSASQAEPAQAGPDAVRLSAYLADIGDLAQVTRLFEQVGTLTRSPS